MARSIHVLQPGGFYAAQFAKRSQALQLVAAGLAFWLHKHAVQMLRPGEKPPRTAAPSVVKGYIPEKMPMAELPGLKFEEPRGFKPRTPRRQHIQHADNRLKAS